MISPRLLARAELGSAFGAASSPWEPLPHRSPRFLLADELAAAGAERRSRDGSRNAGSPPKGREPKRLTKQSTMGWMMVGHTSGKWADGEGPVADEDGLDDAEGGGDEEGEYAYDGDGDDGDDVSGMPHPLPGFTGTATPPQQPQDAPGEVEALVTAPAPAAAAAAAGEASLAATAPA
eukprot:2124543-Prymnesium_polylepis.1